MESEDVVIERLQVIISDDSLVIQLQHVCERVQIGCAGCDVVFPHLKRQIQRILDDDCLGSLVPLREKEVVIVDVAVCQNQHQDGVRS